MTSELNFLKRGLSDSQAKGLRGLAASEADNWWKEVLESKDLLLAVRNGYLNAYVRGQSVFKIAFGKGGSDGGKPRLAIHYKYLVKPDLEKRDPYVSFNGTKFDIEPADIINTEYESKLTLSQLIRTAERFALPEKSGVHKIARKEPKVVDLEIAFTKAGENGDLSAPRMDIAVLVPTESGAELVFCEAKCADNPELWGLEKLPKGAKSLPPPERSTAVIAQIRKYEQFIQAKEAKESLIEGYVRVCRNLVEISSQSPARPVDDLVRQVAEGKRELSIHPHVFLLVYDFGKDEKQGRIKAKRLQLEEAGIKIIAKGKPEDFQLANDILRMR
ncbi:hypothetical protein JQ625_29170 [Bradyrhizobium diazoefficiens]|nr:hypothetical protein [Bradyrhizobium diazoefficiens]MBR0778916.1 hypothetical protein [Bradyrhizobium diazoefficiens]